MEILSIFQNTSRICDVRSWDKPQVRRDFLIILLGLWKNELESKIDAYG